MIIHGIAHWAKILGKPAKAYNPGEFEWCIDVAIDDATRKALIKEGLGDKIKNKGDVRGDFIKFSRKSVKRDGTESKPIKVVDKHNKDWDHSILIGNGSEVNVQFIVNDTEFGGRKFKKPAVMGVQVWKHVPYEGGDREEFPEAPAENWAEEAV